MSPLALLALPLIPGLSALVLGLFGARMPHIAAGGTAAGAAGLAFALSLAFLPLDILGSGAPLNLDLGPWISTHGFQAGLRLRLDSVGLCMTLLVSGFGFLITAYSIGYMRDDGEPGRFFAGINLFLASMLLLVLADNLVLIFLGWEGVGLCSYLLIGHYWRQPGVPLAAFRAFFVNRIGDVFFLLGVFTLYLAFGTVSFSELSLHGKEILPGREGLAAAAALLLLGGAFAKSAQAPLHVWLADAMAGPTPVSALIHAATMVTAGIYLVMRLDWLYAVVPEARFLIGVCALVTLVVGVFMALSQTDIKKILAYSTLANLALMFLALAAGAPNAAMLHLFGHAFFKALLFLAAGSVIVAAHHEQDMRRLQGILRSLPVTRIAFWVGCLGGAGFIPYFSAGFFTKEAVLASLQAADLQGFGMRIPGGFLYAMVLAVESLSAVYLFRLLGSLSGDEREAHYTSQDHHGPRRELSRAIRGVLIILILAAPVFAVFSAGSMLPHWLGGGGHAGPFPWGHAAPAMIISALLSAAAFAVYSRPRRRQAWESKLAGFRLSAGPLARKFYFDDLYAVLFVLPVKGVAWLLRLVVENFFIGILTLAGYAAEGLSLLLRQLQTGRTQQYAAGILLGAVLGAYFLLRG